MITTVPVLTTFAFDHERKPDSEKLQNYFVRLFLKSLFSIFKSIFGLNFGFVGISNKLVDWIMYD